MVKKKPMNTEDKVLYYHSKYITYSRAIAVMWGILVVCFLIITIVCLVQPAWIGTARDSPGRGHFGLWSYYRPRSVNGTLIQYGQFLDFGQVLSSSFQAATVFVGLTVLLTFVCVICLLLFFCVTPKYVFIACGIILAIDAILLLLACIIYPNGWDNEIVVAVCDSGVYNSGDCIVQWAFILAIVAIFDAIVLAILAFVLAFRIVKLLPWQEKEKKLKGKGKTYVVEDDRASNIRYIDPAHSGQPVMVVDQRSERSQPVGTWRSHKSSKHNFNL